MPHLFSALARERIASIRDVQKHPSRALAGITRVIRGGKTIGFFLANEEWSDLMEDVDAAHSPAFRARVKSARKQAAAGTAAPLSDVAARYGLAV